MRRFLMIILLAFTLAGCSASPLSLLTGGGPNVAANVQAGAENNQTVGTTKTVDQTIKDTTANNIEQSSGVTKVRTERVERIVVNEVDWRYVAIIALLAGFLIPSPSEIVQTIRGWFTRKARV